MVAWTFEEEKELVTAVEALPAYSNTDGCKALARRLGYGRSGGSSRTHYHWYLWCIANELNPRFPKTHAGILKSRGDPATSYPRPKGAPSRAQVAAATPIFADPFHLPAAPPSPSPSPTPSPPPPDNDEEERLSELQEQLAQLEKQEQVLREQREREESESESSSSLSSGTSYENPFEPPLFSAPTFTPSTPSFIPPAYLQPAPSRPSRIPLPATQPYDPYQPPYPSYTTFAPIPSSPAFADKFPRRLRPRSPSLSPPSAAIVTAVPVTEAGPSTTTRQESLSLLKSLEGSVSPLPVALKREGEEAGPEGVKRAKREEEEKGEKKATKGKGKGGKKGKTVVIEMSDSE
ncbi:hypothetical protein JCM8547_003237 [Rhodosporidiobolus lusitaniae]